MPLIRKSLPIVNGAGQVRFTGYSGAVDYAIEGDPTKLKFGPARLKGSFRTDPDTAADAFRAGDGVLTLEDGAALRCTMVGHTAGATDVFVELRI